MDHLSSPQNDLRTDSERTELNGPDSPRLVGNVMHPAQFEVMPMVAASVGWCGPRAADGRK